LGEVIDQQTDGDRLVLAARVDDCACRRGSGERCASIAANGQTMLCAAQRSRTDRLVDLRKR
jgi:hypothetical protein